MKQKHVGTKNKKVLITGWILFIIYLVTLSYFLFFSEYYGRTDGSSEYRYNLVLFTEIRRFLTYRHTLGWKIVLVNLLGNILAFVPLGFILPVINKKNAGFFRITIVTLAFSLLIETLQLVYHVGIFDVDDLALNTAGGILGFLCYCICRKWKKA